MGRRKKLRKEEIAEDWCFLCKDGGTLRICDYKDCLKAYHPECVEKDDSLLKTDEKWICNLHFCSDCNKAPKFYCLCCPSAICGHCLCDAEFAIVKGKKGLCNNCLELALLIEEKKDVDSNGHKIDFNAPHTAEFYFHGYWEIIKEKEHLTSQHVISAYNKLKRGKNYACDSDSDEYDDEEEDIDDSENESQIRKRKRSKGKQSATKKKGISSRKEFIGWGSKPLLEFLASIGKDTTEILSHSDVTTVVSQYCKENNLFHPEKKRKIVCDARLQALFVRKSVNRNGIFKLLTSHLAENLDDSEDEFGFSSENDEDGVLASKRQLLSNTFNKSQSKKVILDVQKSRFASIVPKNIKLVYLRKSLLEELSKHLETFDAKVMGSFVRVKSDPNDYLQKNSHQLVQVTGIKKTTSTNSEIVLQVSNMVKAVPICKLSDDDFSEQECEDLCQKVKSGLVKRPTVVELEQKARSLHEEITKHWIARELVLLQKRIDKANEKGWRRELYEYMDRLLLLQKPSEQTRLLSEIPEVIADIVEFEPACEDSVREDKKERNDELPESAPTRTSESPSCNLKINGIPCCLNGSTTDAAAIVTKGETPSIITSDQQYRDESHNGTTGLLPAPALQPSGCEAQISAADWLVADGSNDTRKRGGEKDEDADEENGKKIEIHNGSPSANDSRKCARVDQTNEFKLVIKDMQELEKHVKDMRNELKDLREDIQIQLNS